MKINLRVLLYFSVASCLSTGGLVAKEPALDPGACRGKKMLYVMMLHAEEGADVKVVQQSIDSDKLAIEHLKSLGFEVTATDEYSSVDLAQGKDLIVISETISANLVGAKYKSLPIPAVVMENDIFDDMSMTGMKIGIDYDTAKAKTSYLDLINSPHPLSAGLAAGPYKMYTEIPAKNNWNWGNPGLGAVVIATLPGEPSKAAIFGYEKGATMDYDFLAPARRVGFFQSQRTFKLYTPEALRLYDAAMIWAVMAPQPSVTSQLPGAAGKQMLFVRDVSRLELLKGRPDADPKAIKTLQEVITDDEKTVAHMKSLGFTVTVADAKSAPSLAAGKDVIVVAESADEEALRGKFREIHVPLVVWNENLFPDLRMTGKKADVDFGSDKVYAGTRFFWTTNAPHPLSAGLAAGIQNIYSDADYISWGLPYRSAAIIATLEGEPRKASVFAYERGATMGDDFPAPERRVGLFLNGTFHMLIPEGTALLDSAVLWAAGSIP